LPVIKKPDEKKMTIFTRGEAAESNKEPFMKGEGDLDLICGKCALVLAKSVHAGQITGIVLHCPGCGAYNNVAGAARG
jgi:hypothetical protein